MASTENWNRIEIEVYLLTVAAISQEFIEQSRASEVATECLKDMLCRYEEMSVAFPTYRWITALEYTI